MEKYKASSSYAKHQKVLAEHKAKAEKKPFKKDKNAPKRPQSGYMIFVNEVREKVVSSNPDMKVTDVLREIGSMWRDLSESEQKKYQTEAKKLKAKYEMELEAYHKTDQFKAYQDEKDAFYAERKAKKRAASSTARKVKKPKQLKRRSSHRRCQRSATPKAPSTSRSRSRSRSTTARRRRRSRAPTAP